jgi:hypothetical protein
MLSGGEGATAQGWKTSAPSLQWVACRRRLISLGTIRLVCAVGAGRSENDVVIMKTILVILFVGASLAACAPKVRDSASGTLAERAVRGDSSAHRVLRLAGGGPLPDWAADTIPMLTECLHGHPKWLIRQDCADTLSAFGGPAVPPLTRELRDLEVMRTEGGWNAYVSAKALASIGPDAAGALEPLTASLEDDYAYLADNRYFTAPEVIPQWAALALGTIGPAAEPAVPALVAALRTHPSFSVRGSAAIALGLIGSSKPVAIHALAQALDDQAAAVRGAAAAALGDIGALAAGAIPRIEARLEDPNVEVRQEAQRALHSIAADARIIVVPQVTELSGRIVGVAAVPSSDLRILKTTAEVRNERERRLKAMASCLRYRPSGYQSAGAQPSPAMCYELHFRRNARESASEHAYRYAVRAQDGHVYEAFSDYPGFAMNDCVRVFVAGQDARLALGGECEPL